MGDVCLLLRRRAAPVVETDIEPLVNFGVDRVVLVAELLRCDILLNGFGFCCGAVLIGAADEEGGVAAAFAIPAR